VTDVHAADNVTFPRGSKVIGHVTESKARSKGDTESHWQLTSTRSSGRRGNADQERYPGRAPNPNAELLLAVRGYGI